MGSVSGGLSDVIGRKLSTFDWVQGQLVSHTGTIAHAGAVAFTSAFASAFTGAATDSFSDFVIDFVVTISSSNHQIRA